GSMDPIVTMGFVWFAVLMGATYSGVLTSVVELASEGARRKASSPTGPVAPLVGSAAREVLALTGATQWLARAWEEGHLSPDAALAAAMGVRATASSVRDRVFSALAPVIGSRLYTSGQQAAALALDSLAVHHHPPALLVCDTGVGAACLGAPITFELEK
ncbi:acyl-CoA dehydrogenase, partial [Motilibacter sp. E257]